MTFAMELMNYALITAFVVVGLCQLLAMIRVVIGPGVGDRILALDTMVVLSLIHI